MSLSVKNILFPGIFCNAIQSPLLFLIQNQNSLLMKRQIDNGTPAAGIRNLNNEIHNMIFHNLC